MFSEPALRPARHQRARIDLAYDVLLDAGQTAALDQWMAAAQASGVQVLVHVRPLAPPRAQDLPARHLQPGQAVQAAARPLPLPQGCG